MSLLVDNEKLSKEKQYRKLDQIGIKIHCLRFIIDSLKQIEQRSVDEYSNFLSNELGENHLQRQVSLKLRKTQLLNDINFIPIESIQEKERAYQNTTITKHYGAITAKINSRHLIQSDLTMGFQIVTIGNELISHNCQHMEYEAIMNLIRELSNDDGNSTNLQEYINVTFQFVCCVVD